jgi:hypothetical protein
MAATSMPVAILGDAAATTKRRDQVPAGTHIAIAQGSLELVAGTGAHELAQLVACHVGEVDPTCFVSSGPAGRVISSSEQAGALALAGELSAVVDHGHCLAPCRDTLLCISAEWAKP